MPLTNVVGPGLGASLVGTSTLSVPITSLVRGTTPPTAVNIANFGRGYAYTVNDDSTFSAVLPLDWVPGSDLTLFIRWGCNETYAANSGVVRWYAWGTALTSNATNQVGVGRTIGNPTADIQVPAAARTLREDSLGIAYGGGLAAGDTLGVMLSRILSITGVTPTQEPEIYAVWIQYTRYMLWAARQQ